MRCCEDKDHLPSLLVLLLGRRAVGHPWGWSTGGAGTLNRDQPGMKSCRPSRPGRMPSAQIQVLSRGQEDSSKAQPRSCLAELRKLERLPWPDGFSAALFAFPSMALASCLGLPCCSVPARDQHASPAFPVLAP